MKQPFEVPFDVLQNDVEPFIDAVFGTLQSDFLTMPKGEGFIEYSVFEEGYQQLKKTTGNFSKFDAKAIARGIIDVPITLVVFRTILGFTPPEWAYIASIHSGEKIDQGFARALDRKVRLSPVKEMKITEAIEQRLIHLVEGGIALLKKGAGNTKKGVLHRLQKADTESGLGDVTKAANLGIPYAMVLYERFLGRPFAGHRDSVSDLIGDSLEIKIEGVLSTYGISFRKTRRAEKIKGFDQSPDFIIPDEFSPKVVIEAKITEDDGTARDKVTRIQHLQNISDSLPKSKRFEVIACIGGRGFGVRREDMKKMLIATHGKVFTPITLSNLVVCSGLKAYATKKPK